MVDLRKFAGWEGGPLVIADLRLPIADLYFPIANCLLVTPFPLMLIFSLMPSENNPILQQ
jgi:hypothetical protein